MSVSLRTFSYFIIFVTVTLGFLINYWWFGTSNDTDNFQCNIDKPSHIPVYKTSRESMCHTKKYISDIHFLWANRKNNYYKWMRKTDQKPINLYNIQGETHNLFKYAKSCQDDFIIEELLELYVKAIDTLDKTNKYRFNYYPESKVKVSTHSLDRDYMIWLSGDNLAESILASSQYLALMSEVINYISGIEKKKRTPLMHDFLEKYSLVLKDHYSRWVLSDIGPFQVRGWGCKYNKKNIKTGLNHNEFIALKRRNLLGNGDSPLHCNAVTDTDLWIIYGVSNLMATEKMNSEFNILDEPEYSKFNAYLLEGLKLLSSRISYDDSLVNFKGDAVSGANFDLGVWSDHSNYKYAGINDVEIDKINDLNIVKKNENVGWDLSHSRRFVHVFSGLYENKSVLNTSFPSKSLMESLSNQFLYKVFNQNFEMPLFSNYMDGSNGWYRVNYSGKKGFGYMPWDMSIAALTGGYGFWSSYNKDVNKVYESVLYMFNSESKNIKNHVKKHYEENIWINNKRKNKMNFSCNNDARYKSVLIQFLPSICNCYN